MIRELSNGKPAILIRSQRTGRIVVLFSRRRLSSGLSTRRGRNSRSDRFPRWLKTSHRILSSVRIRFRV